MCLPVSLLSMNLVQKSKECHAVALVRAGMTTYSRMASAVVSTRRPKVVR